MSRKSKIDPIFKIKAVEDILTGRKSICETARELNVNKSTRLVMWILYESNAPLYLLFPS